MFQCYIIDTSIHMLLHMTKRIGYTALLSSTVISKQGSGSIFIFVHTHTYILEKAGHQNPVYPPSWDYSDEATLVDTLQKITKKTNTGRHIDE